MARTRRFATAMARNAKEAHKHLLRSIRVFDYSPSLELDQGPVYIQSTPRYKKLANAGSGLFRTAMMAVAGNAGAGAGIGAAVGLDGGPAGADRAAAARTRSPQGAAGALRESAEKEKR